MPDVFLTRDFKEKVTEAVEDDVEEFVYTDENGQFTTGYYEVGDGWTIREIAPSPSSSQSRCSYRSA